MTPRSRRGLVLLALLGWCAVLLAFRLRRSGSPVFLFLAWNLLLATVPVLAAQLFVWADSRRRHVQQILWFVFWLLFLPNAPYIITDFIHLTPRPPIPLWYDVAVLLSCAATGLLLGYTSLADVQHVITRRFGQAAGWSTAAVSLLLSGFGIYVGRFLRWNSWDAITNPGRLFADLSSRIANPFSHPRTLGMTVIYGTGLLLGYIALRVIGASTERRSTARAT